MSPLLEEGQSLLLYSAAWELLSEDCLVGEEKVGIYRKEELVKLGEAYHPTC